MKKRCLAVFCVSLMVMCHVHGQEVFTEIVAALKKGNVEALVPFLGSEIELVIDERRTDDNKEVVGQELTYFFDRHKVKSFEVNHKGERENSAFIIGNLATGRGVYRVNCFLRKEKNNLRIHQIRIDKK